MSLIKTLPNENVPSGWNAILPRRMAKPALEGDVTSDWVVLGAGFTGLAAARRLAEMRPDDLIVVVDAGEVAQGASGRNSGFAIDHAHTLGGGVAAIESALGQKRLYTTAIDHMAEIVEAQAIECDWRNDGKFHGAASKRGAEAFLKPLQQELDEIGEAHRWLDASDMQAELGTAHFEAGIYTSGTVLVNPAALIRGLADALPKNVILAENSPVTEMDLAGPVVLKTPGGRVTANALILATNAYTKETGFFTRQLLPFVAYASLSRVMTASEQSALGGRSSWGLTPANAFVGATIQRTGDHRILFRQTISYRPSMRHNKAELEQICERHKALFAKRFPMIRNLDLDHTWGGYLGLSRNQDSAFGKFGDHVWGAAGHQGIGVTRGTIGGILAADMAMGLENPLIEDMMRIARPVQNPPSPFLEIGIAAATAWDAWRNRDEA